MTSKSPEELYEIAKEFVGEYTLTHRSLKVGTVAAALLAGSGKVYTGINMDMFCGIGFCAEHAAASQMLKERETHIVMAIAVKHHTILPPCGRCRELMVQMDFRNSETLVVLPEFEIQPLKKLIPLHWMDYADPARMPGKRE